MKDLPSGRTLMMMIIIIIIIVIIIIITTTIITIMSTACHAAGPGSIPGQDRLPG